jgi:hypothetical protein
MRWFAQPEVWRRIASSAAHSLARLIVAAGALRNRDASPAALCFDVITGPPKPDRRRSSTREIQPEASSSRRAKEPERRPREQLQGRDIMQQAVTCHAAGRDMSRWASSGR